MAKILGWSNTEQAPPYSRYHRPAGYRRNRKEVIISRLRIGHTHITHSHFLKGDDPPPQYVQYAKYLLQSDEFTQNITKQTI